MKKIYYLSTCDTCKRIMNELDIPQSFIKQDLKTQAISEVEIEELFNMSESYEALLNKRARLFKERGLKDKQLADKDYLNLILEHYTFLKRPVIVNNNDIFIGNSKKTVEAARQSIHGK